MHLRLHGIELRFDADQEKGLRKEVQKRLGRLKSDLAAFQIARRSIDARKRPVHFVYAVDVTLKTPCDLAAVKGAVATPEKVPLRVTKGTMPLSSRPVVVGGGPAGLFAALLLAEHGYKPILIDRGGDVEERVSALRAFAAEREPDPDCNALFGLGGAGTFSDGKLASGVSHPWSKGVLDIFVECGAPPHIAFDAKPHVGTDVIREVVGRMVSRIEASGGTVHTHTRMTDIRLKNGRLSGIKTTKGIFSCGAAVLAVGHSARDTWQALAQNGIALEPKPFQIGIRAEHPQSFIDALRFGKAGGDPILGAADYKLATKVNGTSVFSFCMCPGGQTIPTVNEAGHLAINGMSESHRGSPFSSSGLVVTLNPEVYGGADLSSCLAFQRSVEGACFRAGGGDYSAPAQRLVDLRRGVVSATLPKVSYPLGVRSANLAEVLPEIIASPLRAALSAFDNAMPGYLHPEAAALAPESRASSPVRIVRNPDSLESVSAEGLYPVGEGAGFAGGIMSSALDGLNAAKKIIEKYRSY